MKNVQLIRFLFLQFHDTPCSCLLFPPVLRLCVPRGKISACNSCNLYFQGSSTSSPSFTSCLTRLTLAMLGLNGFHLFQTFQHAPQVSDAILKGDFLIIARMGTLKQFPHVDWWFLFYRLLLPVSQGRGQKGHLCIRSGEASKQCCVVNNFANQITLSFSLFSGFQQSTEIQISLVFSSIPVCMETDEQY